MGLMIKQVWSSMGKNWGRMMEYREFGKLWVVGYRGIFGSLRSWVKYEGNIEGRSEKRGERMGKCAGV